MTNDNGNKGDLVYGVFSAEEHLSVSHAVAMGFFVGSAWAVVAFAIWAVSAIAVRGADESTRYTLSIIVGMLAGGILQQLWFNYRVSARLPYAGRIAGFGLTYFAVLVGCAWLGQWLPTGNPWAWVGFCGLYLAILAVMTVVFTIVLRRKGVAYQEGLDEYRRRQQR